jgi:hypothetical protein
MYRMRIMSGFPKCGQEDQGQEALNPCKHAWSTAPLHRSSCQIQNRDATTLLLASLFSLFGMYPFLKKFFAGAASVDRL